MDTNTPNLAMNESISELHKLIQLVDEDAVNLDLSQAISDYLVPILTSMLGEIEANRQYILQNADRTNLALLMTEKTFLGEILTGLAEHFATVLEELPTDKVPTDSKLGVALAEMQDLLATWMSLDASADEDEDEGEDEGEDEDEDEDEDEVEEDENAKP